ncbi:hypothetical protein HMPREF9533_02958 [Escherichia coli MS 60-1]|nr:hypothetical protein HMPREF9553_03894 [Escherichia coli MS 200-1]EGB82209.1 hypothetical protein HMPREF9533_02958 [Escherichia coli MS 60-1]ESE35132.1 hypothetical protein HMPREF1622_02127 [Escherichia coli A35218R]
MNKSTNIDKVRCVFICQPSKKLKCLLLNSYSLFFDRSRNRWFICLFLMR